MTQSLAAAAALAALCALGGCAPTRYRPPGLPPVDVAPAPQVVTTCRTLAPVML